MQCQPKNVPFLSLPKPKKNSFFLCIIKASLFVIDWIERASGSSLQSFVFLRIIMEFRSTSFTDSSSFSPSSRDHDSKSTTKDSLCCEVIKNGSSRKTKCLITRNPKFCLTVACLSYFNIFPEQESCKPILEKCEWRLSLLCRHYFKAMAQRTVSF